MDDPRKSRTHELFAACVSLAPAARVERLARDCPDDAEVAAEVQSLLDAHDRAGRFLADPAFLSRALPSEAPARDSRIGPYTLVRVVGEGGCGTVYLAEQLTPVRRQVALKLIKVGMDTNQVISRFELERQALALMDHPNIARLLDAGETEAGRPYFVMELVAGQPITEYCRANRLDSRARLALLKVVCDAVHHAHQKGVIHRDLKPSNVLVMTRDGQPAPKVIDFGIAKALYASGEDGPTLTQQPMFLGTPQYMSPEQATPPADDLDTRCDVYALGALLYELLSGVAPFDPARLRKASYDEVRRIIREVDPPTPSAHLLTLASGTTPPSAGETRGEIRKRLQQVRGELDWVVMKAMEKDRERRYGSAEALGADLERHLRDEPVSAGRPSRWYRARKFVRRHRTAMLAGTSVALALIVGLGVATAGLVQARRQRDLALRATAAESLQRAAADAQRARALASEAEARDEAKRLFSARAFLYQLVSPPVEADKRAVAPIAVLDYIAARLDGKPPDMHAEVEAPLRAALGNAYSKLEMHSKAERQYRINLNLSRSLEHGDSYNLASAMNNLAGAMLWHQGYKEAEPLLRESLAMYRRLDRHDTWTEAPVLSNLGVLLANTSRLDEAEPLLRAAIPLFRSYYGAHHPLVIASMRTLADVLAAKGDRPGAESVRREADDLQN